MSSELEEDESSNLNTTEKRKKEEEEGAVSFDDVLSVLGQFGRYQRLLYFLYSFPYVFTSMQLVGWVSTWGQS